MAEDRFSDEIMSDEELDGVVGGTHDETAGDIYELYSRGLLDKCTFSLEMLENRMHEMGYAGYEAWVDYKFTIVDGKLVGNSGRSNVYTDKKGKIISREAFWANFDAENGTKVIR